MSTHEPHGAQGPGSTQDPGSTQGPPPGAKGPVSAKGQGGRKRHGGAYRMIARKAAVGILTIWATATCVFFAIHLLPGDPVSRILGEDAPEQARADLRARLNLDRPLAQQYGIYVKDLARGRLGSSFADPQRTVGGRLAEAFPHTMLLAACAMMVALGLSLPLGVLGAVLGRSAASRLLDTGALVGLAVPNLWLGPVLLVVFSIGLGWTPLPGDDPARPGALVLPAVTLGTALMAILYRLTRSSMEEVLHAHYVRTARAKGLGPLRILFHHALPNALMPVVSVGGLQLGALLTGTVITEKIFERPGLGTLFLEAYYARDIPVVQGCVLVMAIVYVVVNTLTDAVYVVIDPRLRRPAASDAA